MKKKFEPTEEQIKQMMEFSVQVFLGAALRDAIKRGYNVTITKEEAKDDA